MEAGRLRERAVSEMYAEKVGEVVSRYGEGMLRGRHRNSLGVSSKEGELVQLHYRLKKERERAIIERE